VKRTRLRVSGLGSAGAFALPMLLVISLILGAAPQWPPPPPVDGDPDPAAGQFSVSVDLVVLHATVRDRKGHIVADLQQEHFEVFEDSVRQNLRLFLREDIPVAVGLVVDHSGSMKSKFGDVLAAARAFVHSSNPNDEMFVVNFNENVSLGLPHSLPFTNDADQLERAIAGTPVTGQTALYDAVGEALDQLQRATRDKKVLIVISDGGDNASSLTMDQVVRLAQQSSALIYTVGIFDVDDEDRNPAVLRRLATASGGEAYLPEASRDLPGVCQRIAQDIRNQYTIGYVSGNEAKPGTFRSIRVVAKTPRQRRLIVHTRSGYVAAGEAQPVKEPGSP
jgi:Ca-activated chloride channel homolog